MIDEKKVVKDLFQRYLDKQREESGTPSRAFVMFKEKKPPEEYERYYRMCKFSSSVIHLKNKDKKIQFFLDQLYLPLTPSDTIAFAILVTVVSILLSLGILIVHMLYGIVAIILSTVLYYYLYTYPERLYKRKRVQSSTELILAVLYLIIFMRNNPNLEHAIRFASENLRGPLSLDFAKVLWDVETNKYSTVQESLDNYLQTWTDRSRAFVDAVHLIEASLYQKTESSRMGLLDGALNRILSGTTESMVHYVNDLRTPISALFMMGITLPTMGLVLLPIVGAFMGGMVTADMIFLFYDILIPVLVLYLAQNMLEKRPIAFPQPDVSKHPEAPPLGKIKLGHFQIPVYLISALVFVVFTALFLTRYNSRGGATNPSDVDVYWSLLITVGLGLAVWSYTYLYSKPVEKIRQFIHDMEIHFADAIFQLGSRMEEGFPAEIALVKVAKGMRSSSISVFINKIVDNMYKLGHNLEKALFDEKEGAIRYFPSTIIDSTMRVFASAARKSTKVAADSLIAISNYLRKVHQIEEKLMDVLAETMSELRFQASFIAPIIGGIVVGLTTMVIIVLSSIQSKIAELQASLSTGGISGMFAIGMIKISNSIPLDVFQIIVGVYMVEIVVISAILSARIQYGEDKLSQLQQIYKMVLPSLIMYLAVTILTTVIFVGVGRMAVVIGESV